MLEMRCVVVELVRRFVMRTREPAETPEVNYDEMVGRNEKREGCGIKADGMTIVILAQREWILM